MIFAAPLSPRTGFVDGPVWFSEESISFDEPLTTYAAIFNGEKETFSATVQFLDGETLLSEKKVAVLAGQTETVSAVWRPGLGSHKVTAKIISATLSGGAVIPERTSTEPISFTVTKEVPGNVAARALGNGAEDLLAQADAWFEEHFAKSEAFRKEKIVTLTESKEKVVQEKQELKDKKVPTKVLVYAHLVLLYIVCFVFSVSVIFYLVAALLAYIVLRCLWRILKRIFRRKYEE